MNKITVPISRRESLWGWVYLLLQLFALPSLLVLINFLAGNPLSDASINFIFFALNFICVTVIFRRFLLDSLALSAKQPIQCIRAAIKGFFLYYVLSICVNIFIVIINPDFSNVNDDSIAQMTQGNFALMAIGTVLLVPPVEETLYRGLIFHGLYDRSKILAYILSVTLFATIHVVGYIGLYDWSTLLMCFLQYIPAGICLAWAYNAADSILAPILIHMIINLIGILSTR